MGPAPHRRVVQHEEGRQQLRQGGGVGLAKAHILGPGLLTARLPHRDGYTHCRQKKERRKVYAVRHASVSSSSLRLTEPSFRCSRCALAAPQGDITNQLSSKCHAFCSEPKPHATLQISVD